MSGRSLDVVLVLAFDTSTPAVSVALIDVRESTPLPRAGRPDRLAPLQQPPTVLAERSIVASNRHGELLTPMIHDIFEAAEVRPTDLSAIGVGLGPGPFTGLRVGVVTAASMADALRVPAYGDCSLDAISDLVPPGDVSYAVLTDARRKQVYWASYGSDGQRLSDPEISDPLALPTRFPSDVTHVVGAGAQLYRHALLAFTVIDDVVYPSAVHLARRASTKRQLGSRPGALTPMYLRRPDAVPPGRPKQVTPV